jgi:signal transduction histidine kinase
MGLQIQVLNASTSREIEAAIEAHQGQLWATANTPRGAIFQFTLPTRQSRTESNQ